MWSFTERGNPAHSSGLEKTARLEYSHTHEQNASGKSTRLTIGALARAAELAGTETTVLSRVAVGDRPRQPKVGDEDALRRR